MDKEGFRRFLLERQIAEDKIEPSVLIVDRFEHFMKESDQAERSPGADDIRAFSALLMREKLNTYDHYLALARYGLFVKNNEMYVAVVELLDGSEALENLHKKLGETVGEQKRDEVFRDIDLPPLGTPSTQKPRITQTVMERLERIVDPETSKGILSDSLRDLRDEAYLEEKEKYLECGSLDAYLERRGQEFIAQLEQIKSEGGLYFTQEITDEVIDFVRNHPEIRQGVRDGHVLYEIKIPYMTREYLAETDAQMKRYYYCHCPWVRESLKSGRVSVSPRFCQCSVGFHKKSWEVIFGQPLEGEIVESVLQGDPWCKIAIHLPELAV
jgi:hypothetical protein